MVWTAPVVPVAGTVITVAWATSSVVAPLNWLRLMTGNADPPGSGYVVVSSSASVTAWGKVTNDVLASGSITSDKLATPYLPLTGGTLSGELAFSGSAGILLSGGGHVRDSGTNTQINANNDILIVTNKANTVFYASIDANGITFTNGGRIRDTGANTQINANGDTFVVTNEPGNATIAVLDFNGLTLANGGRIRDTAANTQINANGDTFSVTNEANTVLLAQIDANGLTLPQGGRFRDVGALTQINANGDTFVVTNEPGNATWLTVDSSGLTLQNGGRLRDTISNTQINANGDAFVVTNEANNQTILSADMVTISYKGQGIVHSGNIGAQTVAVAGVANSIADGAVSTTAKIADNVIISSKIVDGTIIATDVNSAYVDGFAASPSMRTLGTGSQQAAPGDHSHSGALVPQNLIAAFGTASQLAAAPGWTRYSAADGRMLVGAGTTSGTGQSFAENVNTGSGAWVHNHAATGLSWSGSLSGLSFTGTGAGTSGPSAASTAGGGAGSSVPTDNHTHTYTPAGTVSGSVSGGVGGSVGDTNWIPPSRGVVWAQKL